MTYQECIEWLEGVSLYAKKDGLTNMFQLMEKLEDPQEQIPVIHVAGTNGKGTTCALLEGMLRQAGQRTGLYTSPHLVRYTERIRVDNEEISQEDFAAIGTQVREKAEEMEREGKCHPTFFQLLTAIALVYFRQKKVEIMILEVGVGGRLDATNIVKKPLLTVIASISLDHTRVLGGTIREIAGEKAGIMKPGVPAVICHNTAEAMEVFYKRAEELGCPLYEADNLPCGIVRSDEKGICLKTDFGMIETHLCGDYQIENLKSALTAARLLKLPRDAVTEGIRKTRWSGRMQRIRYAEHADLLLEGAHNEEGAAALGRWCREHLSGQDVTLIFSALRKKDVSSILKGLLTGTPFRRVIFARMKDGAGLEGEEFMKLVGDFPATAVESVEKALQTAYKETSREGLVICAGSLYLVGEVLALLERDGSHV